MQQSAFTNRRVRFQRLVDAKFFTGWVRVFTQQSLVVSATGPVDIRPGEEFAFQVFGEGKSALFKAVCQACSGSDMSFARLDPFRFIDGQDSNRLMVHGIRGVAVFENRSLEVHVTDVGRNGVGMLLSESLTKGDEVQLSLDCEHGHIVLNGEVRYCRRDPSYRAAYRAGLKVSPENRIDLVRWQRLLGSSAA